MRDQRAQYRLPFYCEARIDGLDTARDACRIADISVGGAFIEAKTVLPVGARACARFTLLGHEIATGVEVEYLAPGIGMGVRFTDLSQLGEVVIRTLIAHEAGQRKNREA